METEIIEGEPWEVVRFDREEFVGTLLPIDRIIHDCGLCCSRSEAQRKIKEGAVSIDGERILEIKSVITIKQIKEGMMVRVGKRVKKVSWQL